MKKTSKRITSSIASATLLCSAITFSFISKPELPDYEAALTANAVDFSTNTNVTEKELSTTSTAPIETTTMTALTTTVMPPGYDQHLISGLDVITAKDDTSITFADYGTFYFTSNDYEKQTVESFSVGDVVEFMIVYGMERYNGVPTIEYIQIDFAKGTTSVSDNITTDTPTTYSTTKAYVEGYQQYSVSAVLTISALDENSVTFDENYVTFENYRTFGFAGIDIYEQLAQYHVGDMVNISFYYDLDSPDGSPVIQDIIDIRNYNPPVTTVHLDGEGNTTVTTTVAIWTKSEETVTTTHNGLYYDLPLEFDSSPMHVGETRTIKYGAYYIHSIEATENISYEIVENDSGVVESIIITALEEGDATLAVHLYDSIGIAKFTIVSADASETTTGTMMTYIPETTTAILTTVDDPVYITAEKQTIPVNETIRVEFEAEWAKELGYYPDYYESDSDCVTVEPTNNPYTFGITGVSAGKATVTIGFSNGAKGDIEITVNNNDEIGEPESMNVSITVINAETGKAVPNLEVILRSDDINDITLTTNENGIISVWVSPYTYKVVLSKNANYYLGSNEYTVTPENNDITVEVHAYGLGDMNYIYGDANGDEKVSLADCVTVLQYLSNSEKYPIRADLIEYLDVYNKGDGITAMDALAIQWYDSGAISELPYYNSFVTVPQD